MTDTIIRDLKVGDTIRSYDFMGHTDCYMEGTITEIKDGLYYCKGLKRVIQGIERLWSDFRTPIESFMDFDGRIVKIS